MLADFRQALGGVTASPELCQAVRDDAALPLSRYALTDRELQRLLGIARHPGMACACTVYRTNRLAPLAMNLMGTLRALGPSLRPLISAYWQDHPRGHAHFFLESDRFCCWLRPRIEAGERVPPDVSTLLQRDAAAVRATLKASCTEFALPA